MRTSRIEVSQQSSIPLLKRLVRLLCVVALSINEVGDNQLNCALGSSIGVCRADWAVFWDGNHIGDSGRITVDGGGGGEDNVRDIVLLHAAQENDGSAYVHAVVLERDLARLTDCLVRESELAEEGDWRRRIYLERCEVDDTVNIWVRCKGLVQCFLICDVYLVEIRSLSAKQLNAVKRDFRGVVERVNDHDFIASLEKSQTREGANVAGASAIDTLASVLSIDIQPL